jgi:UDP-glucose 4-epimerase
VIVVIGASSFIGTYLVDELVAQRREVFATAREHLDEPFYASRKVASARLDITKEADFAQLPTQEIEAVVLLAACLPANVNRYEPQRYIDVNVTGTLNVLEYCRKSRARKIIFASSHSDVAGLWDCARPITEDDAPAVRLTGDHAVYIITKKAAMDLVEHYHLEFGVQGISFRLPAVYGYGPHSEIYVDGKAVVPGFEGFLRKAMAGEPIEVWGDGRKGRDLVYVKDVVGAFVGAIDSDRARGLYNIATGVVTPLEDEIKGIVEVFSPPDRPSPIVYRPDKPNNVTYVYDISKAKRDLSYRVRFPYMAMLADYKAEMRGGRFAHLIGRGKKT